MGKLDDMAKELYEDNLVFADTMNVLFFDGVPVIGADDLSPLDANEEHTILDDGVRTFTSQKYRDVLRMLQTSSGTLQIRIIVGTELQSHVHYAMPIRNLEYDALNLARQLSGRQKYNREHRLLKSKNAFLSGINKGEKFTPVLTVVVYFGNETWDAPETLHEMLNLEGIPNTMRRYVPNYQVALLQPDDISTDQLTRMKSPLRHILGVIKSSSNWDDMNHYIKQNKESLSHMDSLAAGIISEACNMNIPKQELDKEDVNMCEAIVQLQEIGRQEGRREGELKGQISAYLELGQSDEWILNRLQISQEKLDAIRNS